MDKIAVRIPFPPDYPQTCLINSKDCGNSFSSGGGPATDGFSQCDMPCSGNSSEFCSGPYRMDMYQAPGTGAKPINMSSSASSPSTASSSTAQSLTVLSFQTSAAMSPTAILTTSSPSSSAATKIPSATSTTKTSSPIPSVPTIALSMSSSSIRYLSTH